MGNLTLITKILEDISAVKRIHLLREYAEGFCRAEGVEYYRTHLPSPPDISDVTTLEDLSRIIDTFIEQANAQHAIPYGVEEGDVIEFGRGSKFYNELPMGSQAEIFLSAYLRLTSESKGQAPHG